MIGHLILRLTLWFLLTANGSVENIIIGVVIALLLPRNPMPPEKAADFFRVLGKIAVAVPVAYIEAFELMVRPHQYEDVVLEPVSTVRSSRLVFLDVFLITFTPKTIVLKYNEAGWYEVHRVRRRPLP
jgi:multicomponent Na+:H+ antiporter subunit E